MADNFDHAFSAAVKQIQSRKGSRDAYANMASRDDERAELNDNLIDIIAPQKSFYLGTSSADGQPYIQHRGGPAGFLHVLDKKTLAFADFKGNRQYISQGNLSENPKAFLFLMDYLTPRRLKLWGNARVVESDQELMDKLMPQDYQARPEQVIVFDLTLWDLNCHQHIPRLVELSAVAEQIEMRDQRIAELEARVGQLSG